MTVTVRAATRNDLAALGAVFADAFFDDPVFTWMFPDDNSRIRRSARFFEAEARHHMLALGGTEIVERDGRVGGAAMWAPPDRWRAPVGATLRMLPQLLWALGRNVDVGRSVDSALESAHPAEPHWYLSTIGTASHARGAGCGTALLKSRLDRIDSEHAPAYLESSKESNVPYYERFGFTVTREIHVPGGGPTLWAMWRDPR
ncbi:acetyltransferase (GNAT) family protein [Rhodococcus sp. SMB37]|uniref:GNAT family N-acetyltransferase n=1 Tax=Rhodococcus sp. SMB37 TaxID=2512213 RepID=UPI0006D1152D|nr:GNAT family N-acetyltransferase [Rhodococcus sp. SMB37]TCN58426.1 acetyltransferase (GNAT) family protein [Rhodococcus sp. SMB37]